MRAAALALLLAGCASVPTGTAPLGVEQALQRGDELDGLLVSVEGVAQGCDVEGCRLRDSASASGPILKVGGSAAFANAMRRASGRLVTVRGRFDSACLRGSAPKAPTTGLVACVGAGTPLKTRPDRS